MDTSDTLLEARILDAAALCERRWQPQFLGFLDERQKAVATRFAKEAEGFLFWGGYDGAGRTMLGVFPTEEVDCSVFPLTGIEVSFRKADVLSHRDVLGSLMALGIKRETVGDILTQPGRAVFFLQSAAAPYVLENLVKIGRVGVRCTQSACPKLPPPGEMETLERTVASLRLDNVLSAVLPLSRSKCAALIGAGDVALRHEECRKTDAAVEAGNVISVRGYGKFRVDAVGSQSKKGRLHITMKRYL